MYETSLPVVHIFTLYGGASAGTRWKGAFVQEVLEVTMELNMFAVLILPYDWPLVFSLLYSCTSFFHHQHAPTEEVAAGPGRPQ